MAKKKNQEAIKIPVSELEVGGTYKTWVQDIVKILEIQKDKKTIKLYNITGAHKQWTEFKNINLIERIR